MQKLKELASKIGKVIAGIFTATICIFSVYLLGRKKGEKETAQKQKVENKAEEAMKTKEEEIEKTDAHTLISSSSKSDDYSRAKDKLYAGFSDTADIIAETLLRR